MHFGVSPTKITAERKGMIKYRLSFHVALLAIAIHIAILVTIGLAIGRFANFEGLVPKVLFQLMNVFFLYAFLVDFLSIRFVNLRA